MVGSRSVHEYCGTSLASSTMHKSICAIDLMALILCLRPRNMNSVPFLPRMNASPTS